MAQLVYCPNSNYNRAYFRPLTPNKLSIGSYLVIFICLLRQRHRRRFYLKTQISITYHRRQWTWISHIDVDNVASHVCIYSVLVIWRSFSRIRPSCISSFLFTAFATECTSPNFGFIFLVQWPVKPN